MITVRIIRGLFWWWLLLPTVVIAMQPEQFQKLPGVELLDLRVNTLFERCGLPRHIDDNPAPLQPRRILIWERTEMTLSPKEWDVLYTRDGEDRPGVAWRNAGAGDFTCLRGLTSLRLSAAGEVGFLSVKKRRDRQGYTTSYQVPENDYAAHQVASFRATWRQGKSNQLLLSAYGQPEEVLLESGGITVQRYWVVERDNHMPVSVHAVDFVLAAGQDHCEEFRVYGRGTAFVQEKFDRLLRDWERVYILD